MKACENREVWFETPRRIAYSVERKLRSMNCIVSVIMSGEGSVSLEAKCGSCVLRVRARLVGPIPDSLGTPARLAQEAGLGRVLIEFDVKGDCSEACKMVELTLFRAGG